MQDMSDIYKEYFATVNKYLFCLTHDNNLSEELTQETFYRAVKKINSFKGTCKLSVWLCQIAKNLWYDELKRNKRFVELKDNELFSLEALENIEETFITSEDKINLYNKIKKLDKEVQKVIYLRITEDLTFKEIADILNKTESWVRVSFYRGKQKLKEVDDYGREKGL